MLALSAPESNRRLAAIAQLERVPGQAPRGCSTIASRSRPTGVRTALQRAVVGIEASLRRADTVGLVFSGLSLGSVLLLAALGLAVTFGLMGVINMAHGELLMVGAYATWMVQLAFRRWRRAGSTGTSPSRVPPRSSRSPDRRVSGGDVVRKLYGARWRRCSPLSAPACS